MSLIKVTDLTFGYAGAANIFENASFNIDTNWKLGLTGRNGRGKTTFLKLLLGCYGYGGTIAANVAFEYFPYDIAKEDADAAAVLRSAAGSCPEWRIAKEMNILGLPAALLGRSFRSLSNGERTKILLAALFLRENSFLLIDEPTNHLDAEGRALVGEYLNKKSGFILVSHDRALLDGCVDHILSINRSSIEVVQGNFSSWQRAAALRERCELTENERLKREMARLESASRRASEWSERVEKSKRGAKISGVKADKGYIGHKAAKMMKRSKNLEGRQRAAIEEKSKLLRDIELEEPLKMLPLRYHSELLAEAVELSISYGGNTVCEGVCFTIMRGDRVALRGGNGSGKTSIIRLLRGEKLSYGGCLKVGASLKISSVHQDLSALRGSLREYAARLGVDESIFKANLRKLELPRELFERDISTFSAGQRKKTAIAVSLSEQAHLYLWDEPLNYIDVVSRMQIEALLKDCAPTLLFVEHDAAFCANIATKTVEL